MDFMIRRLSSADDSDLSQDQLRQRIVEIARNPRPVGAELALGVRNMCGLFLQKTPMSEILRSMCWEGFSHDLARRFVEPMKSALPNSDVMIWKTDIWNQALETAPIYKDTVFETAMFARRKPQAWLWRNEDVEWPTAMLLANGLTPLDQILLTGWFHYTSESGRDGVCFYSMFTRGFAQAFNGMPIDELPRLRLFPVLDGMRINTIIAPWVAAMDWLRTPYVETKEELQNKSVLKRIKKHPVMGVLPIPRIRTVCLRERWDAATDLRGQLGGTPGVLDADGNPVQWRGSWKVSRHPRRQWYAKEGVHRVRWIEPYRKQKHLPPITDVHNVSR
jgi:hypothetical protein